MTNPNLSAIRCIDLDSSLASLCSWCRHSEFIHTESGPCLFSECTCPRFFPMAESAPLGESAGESARSARGRPSRLPSGSSSARRTGGTAATGSAPRERGS